MKQSFKVQSRLVSLGERLTALDNRVNEFIPDINTKVDNLSKEIHNLERQMSAENKNLALQVAAENKKLALQMAAENKNLSLQIQPLVDDRLNAKKIRTIVIGGAIVAVSGALASGLFAAL